MSFLGGFMADYSQIDQSPLINFLFYPRKDFTLCPQGAFDLSVPVDAGISISIRFYEKNKDCPWILYFHGNGEVVSDYDDIAPLYQRMGMNLVVADYRGYGASNGFPNFSHLIHDGRKIFEKVIEEIGKRDIGARVWVMGRSMGSIAALDLAYHFPDKMRGMIIESGFASVTRLIKHLNLPARGIDLDPIEKERIGMIRKISVPALIIHGEYDNLVPLQEAKDLFAFLGAKQKKLIIIPKADHNSVMAFGMQKYFESIKDFVAPVA
jgi:alpha-beta hydrolase superfamily lysophospholipase